MMYCLVFAGLRPLGCPEKERIRKRFRPQENICSSTQDLITITGGKMDNL
jgi:glycerol-3-phosphate dehydrogenase